MAVRLSDHVGLDRAGQRLLEQAGSELGAIQLHRENAHAVVNPEGVLQHALALESLQELVVAFPPVAVHHAREHIHRRIDRGRHLDEGFFLILAVAQVRQRRRNVLRPLGRGAASAEPVAKPMNQIVDVDVHPRWRQLARLTLDERRDVVRQRRRIGRRAGSMSRGTTRTFERPRVIRSSRLTQSFSRRSLSQALLAAPVRSNDGEHDAAIVQRVFDCRGKYISEIQRPPAAVEETRKSAGPVAWPRCPRPTSRSYRGGS